MSSTDPRTGFSQSTRSSIRRIDPSQLQENLSGAFVPDDAAFPSDYNILPDPSDLSYSESRGGYVNPYSATENANDDFDPSRLYFLLEEALPKHVDVGQHRELSKAELQQKREQMEETWNLCRHWLWAHGQPEHRQAAARFRGQADATALHLMCKLHNPPHDIVQAIVEADPETVSWVDSHGWLPLHHACATGVNPDVMRLLIANYMPGLLMQDHLGRTPLHFFVTRSSDNPAAMAEDARMLCASGAAELTDQGGMLPMHYACAYGTDAAVLQVLVDVYPDSLTTTEDKGRTPMHLVMVNAHRDASPHVIRFLLDYPSARATVNTRDKDRFLPLHLLAAGLHSFRSHEHRKRQNVSECMIQYLDAKPFAGADFLTAIQDMPEWLQDTAVVSQHLRKVLNEKIVQPFPTAILMLDGFMLVAMIIAFGFASSNHIDLRFGANNSSDNSRVAVAFCFVCASYFLSRELVQIISLLGLGSLSSYFGDPTNLLDSMVIFLVYFYAIMMTNDSFGLSDRTFRSGVAITQGILYVDVIVYLKSTYIDFAVFVGGVFYVVKRLTAFLMAVGVILLAFAQMFFFIYIETPVCNEPTGKEGCNGFPHCSFENSLLKVYTMMMGEIGNEQRYAAGPTSLVAQVLYVLYAFLVVILLSNVLIAIVTDSYEIIQNDRAAIVFWTNRLDFVAEMEAIMDSVQKRLGCFFRKPKGDPGAALETAEGPLAGFDANADTTEMSSLDKFLYKSWDKMMLILDASLYDDVDMIDMWLYNIVRVVCLTLVIPTWLCVGMTTVGCLWPPQVREFLFVQKWTHVSRAERERQNLEQLKDIQAGLHNLKREIRREMAHDRDEMLRVRTEVETVQGEVLSDLSQVKELMTSLLGM